MKRVGEIRTVKQSFFRRENQRRNPKFDFFGEYSLLSVSQGGCSRGERERDGDVWFVGEKDFVEQ